MAPEEDCGKLSNEEMAVLKAAFAQAMRDMFNERYKPPLKYYASRLIGMFMERNGDGVRTAKDIVWGPRETSYGLEILTIEKRLDLSVQALVLQPKFKCLFTKEDRQQAHDTLCKHGFRAAWDLHPCDSTHCKCADKLT